MPQERTPEQPPPSSPTMLMAHGGVRVFVACPAASDSPPHRGRELFLLGKIIICGRVAPTSQCSHIAWGAEEEDVRRNAAAHAEEHGLTPTPELRTRLRSFIEDEGGEIAP